MSKKYKGFKKLNVRLFIVFLSCFSAANAHNERKMFSAAKEAPVDVLEWQLAARGYGQPSLSVRMRAEPTRVKKQDRQKLPFTGSVRVFGQTGQSFLVCAQSLDAEGFFQETVAAAMPAANVYFLRLGGTVGELTIDQGQPCPEYFGHQYPFVSGLYIRSENAFSVVAKRTDPSNDKAQNNNDRMVLPLNLPAELSSRLGISGGGHGTDDHNDFKRPPFMSAPDKMMAQLLFMPALNLPANWRDYLPLAGLYHWFAGTGSQGVTLLIRFNNEPALRLDISQAEFRELAPMLPDTAQLLHWLAPKLNGREHLAQQLTGLLSQESELMLPESAREAIERQLAIILEQPDSAFSLEFEYSQLQSALRGQEQPTGVVELGNGMSKTATPVINRGVNQQGSSDNPAKRQDDQHSQRQGGQPPSAPGNAIIIPAPVIDAAPPEDFILVAHQTQYHINSQEVLMHLPDLISEAQLQLECQDCRQQISPMEIVSHAQNHQLTCAECGEFQPGAVPLAARQNQLECHTASHCENFRSPVPAMPAVDASLTTLRFMLRFGTEETLLMLLPLIKRQTMVAALGQTDHERRTFVHDLARYSPDSVTLVMVEFLDWLGKTSHLEARDIYDGTPLDHMLLNRSEDFILKLSAYLDKPITLDDKTALVPLRESGETALIAIPVDDRRGSIIPPVSHSDSAWSLLPDEILASIFSWLSPIDLVSCRVVNRRANSLIQDQHLQRDVLWRHCSPLVHMFSLEAWENNISLSLRTKQDDDGSGRNQKAVAHLEACKNQNNFHKILFHTLATIKTHALWSFQLSEQIQSDDILSLFAFSPNGRFLVTCWDNSAVCINVWQGNSPGQEVFRERLYDNKTMSVCFSPDSQTLAVWPFKGAAFILACVENDKWQQVHQVQDSKSSFNLAVFSPNGLALLICTENNNNRILTCQRNNSWVELKPVFPEERILSASFTADSQTLTVVKADKIVHIPLFENSEELKVKPLQVGGRFKRASFSPDGRVLVIASQVGNIVHILTRQGADIKICSLTAKGYFSFSFSPNSQYLVMKSTDTARIYTHRGEGVWKKVYKIEMRGNSYGLLVIFSPDSQSLLTTTNDFLNRILNIHTCNSRGAWKKVCEATLPYGCGFSSRVHFSPDSFALVTSRQKALSICRIMFNIQQSWSEF